MAVSEERGRGFEELLLKLESNDSQKAQPFSCKGYKLCEFKSGNLPRLQPTVFQKVCSHASFSFHKFSTHYHTIICPQGPANKDLVIMNFLEASKNQEIHEF